MPRRSIRFYREPAVSAAPPTTDLQIDLLELSHAAAKETLQTGMYVGAWLDLFEAALTADADLRWRDQGMGCGRELKRSFSNILGRFVARYYLESKEGVVELIPIDGDQFEIGDLVVRRKSGQTGDLPDWIGYTAHSLVIAEAKGSHDRADWSKKANSLIAKPQVIENAKGQVTRVEIARAHDQSISYTFKGWSVGSRWATEKNGLDPWLMAIDPKQGDEPLPPEDFENTKRAILKCSNLLMLRTLGFSQLFDGASDETSIDQFYPSSGIFPVRLDDETEIPKSLHAIAGPFGFLPIRTRRDFRFVRLARRFAGQSALISITSDRLNGEVASSETIRRSDNSVERNGVVLTLIARQTDLRIVE